MSSEAGPAESSSGGRSSTGRFAFLIAAGIFLSRFAGLIRERVFAHYFGSSPAAGAFKAALRIPNFLQNMFGEGVLSASFIPVYARLVSAHDEKTAGRVAGVVATLLAIAVAILVAVGVLLTPFIVALIAPGFDPSMKDLTIRLVRILFPGIGLLVLSAWCLGILNSHRKFFVSYVAPVLWNFAMIAALIIFGGADKPKLAEYLAWGTVVGCVLQFAVQLPFVWKYAKEIRFGIDTALEPVREIVRNFVPVFFGRGVVQVSAYVDEVLSSLLGAAVFASLSFAQTIYLLPVSLFGMSVAAAELPEMSRDRAGSSDAMAEKLRTRLGGGLRQIAFLVIPTVVAFLIIGRYFVSGLYETGAFDVSAAFFVSYILGAYAVGLLAATMGRLYSSAFYALGDTKTPLKIALIRVVVGAGLAYLFAFPLRAPFIVLIRDGLGLPMPTYGGGAAALGAVGLAFGSAVAAWVEFVLLRRALQARVGEVRIGGNFFLLLFSAAVIAAVAALFVAQLTTFVREFGLPFGLAPLMHAGLVALIFGAIYFGVTAFGRVPETNRIVRRLLRR